MCRIMFYLLFGIVLTFHNTILLANEALKQKIVAFEQSVPWSDVYDGFKARQQSWHKDVMAATSPQELGRLLIEFQSFIIKERLTPEWDKVKPQWITKTSNAATYDVVDASLKQLQDYYFKRTQQDGSDIKKDIITFEQYVPWEDVKDGFRSRQQGWHYDVINAKTPQQLGNLLLEFQEWIYPEKFSNEWGVVKPAWIKKAKNAATWNDVKDLLKELQWNYRKGK